MPGFWRQCRIAFRCVRFAVWAVLLAALGAFGWFNQVGLPDFLKTRLVAALHERGVALEFSRMRLRLIHGLVCENVRLGEAKNSPASPVLTAREVQLRLDFPALLHRQLRLDGLVLRGGRFTLPLTPTNGLALTNLQTELRFAADDFWRLDHFSAECNGMRLLLAGEVAHAPEIRRWKMFAGPGTGDRGALTASLRNFSDTLAALRFEGRPQLNLRLDGDARDVHSFRLRLGATVPGVRTPWFSAQDLQATASLTAPASVPANDDAAWGFWTNLQPFQLAWSARAAGVRSQSVNADAVECEGAWRAPELRVTRLTARLGGGKLDAGARLEVATRAVTFTNDSSFDLHAAAALLTEKTRARLAEISWTHPPVLHAEGGFTLPPWSRRREDWQDDIEPSVRLHGELAFTNAVAQGVPVDWVRTHFAYSNRVWRLPDLALAQGRTQLALQGEEDEATKNFHCQLGGVLDAASVRPFLTTSNAARGFDQVSFSGPLTFQLDATGNLYDLDRLAVKGDGVLTNFSVGSHRVDSARTQLAYSNQVWRVAELELAQGRTRLALAGEADAATQNFRAQLRGALDAASVRPFLTASNAVRGFGHLSFSEPLAFQADAAGNWQDWSRLTAAGSLALTNFAIRQQTVEWLTADFTYSNLTAEFFHPQLARAGGTQKFAADRLTLDLAGQKLFFAGGAGNVEPMVVARAIGPRTAEAMEPYQFLAIPQARVNGCVPLRHDAAGEVVPDDADLRFDIVGTTPFRWKRFETRAITGTIHWWKNFIILTNAVSECYGGEARGWGQFDVSREIAGTDFSFFVTGTNADLRAMGLALWSPTNQLEGALSGWLTVTRANSEDWRTWNGYGAARLRDGLLWSVPVFGLVSPVLNAVSPGLGNNRATEAAGRFTMTNGVIYTDSLQIHTAMMRLDYNGTVDLQERVNARVTAQLMRNMPLLGGMMSWVLLPVSKIFECKVTGTLGEPKPTPVYLPFPKLLLAPLQPIRTVEELFAPSK